MPLTLRNVKGSPLTYAEADANFSGLADLSLTTFLQSGTGAVADTIQNKARRRYDVLDVIDPSLHAAIKARTNTTDLAPFIQQALNNVGVAGGGGLVFGPGDYLCHTATTSGGLTGCLYTKYDNVELHLEAGAVLKTDIDAYLLLKGGFFKPGGITGWAAYEATNGANYGSTFTLYSIAGASKYASSVTLSTPAQYTNFQVGDWILIRCGQTLTVLDNQPIGEYNKIKAINSGTGALTLEYPLRNTYSAENYPVGHASAGLPAPFGIVNCTRPYNVLLHGFSITGNGRMENSSATANALIAGNQTIREVRDGPEFYSYGWAFSEGSTLSRHVNTRIHLLGAATAVGYSQDKCNHDWVLDDTIISSVAGAQIHLHEGCSGQIGSGVTIISAVPIAGGNAISMRARSHDIEIGAVRVIGFAADAASPAIFGDSTTDRITIGNAHVLGAVNSSAAAISLSGTNCSVGIVNTDTGVAVSPDLGNTLAGQLTFFIPASAMFTQQGVPTHSLINSGGSDGWLLDDASTEGLTMAFKPPAEWKRCKIRWWWDNTTVNAGNVRFLAGWNVVADGSTMTIINDGNFGQTETADSQNKLNVSAIGSGEISSLTAAKIVNLVLQRLGADGADTLTGDIALIGVELVRTF